MGVRAWLGGVLARVPTGSGTATRAIAQISGGMLIAQILGIIALPLLTRLYAPSAFGVFGLVTSLSVVLTPVLSLRLEWAIPIAGDEKEAVAVTRTALGLALVLALVSCPFVVAAQVIMGPTTASEYYPAMYLLPLVALLASWFTTLSQFLIRLRNYRAVARRNALQGAGTVVGQVGLGLVAPTSVGLLLGQTLGRIVSIWSIASPALRHRADGGSVESARIALTRFWRFPVYYVPAGLLNALGAHLPLLIAAAWYGSSVAGYLAVVQRLLIVPASLLGASIGQVLLGQLAMRAREQTPEQEKIVLRALARLLPFGGLIVAGAAFVLPWALPAFLGADWGQAGAYCRAWSLAFGMSFVAGPLQQVLVVNRNAVTNLLLDGSRVILVTAAALTARNLGLGPESTVFLMALAQGVNYAATILLAWLSARAADRSAAVAIETGRSDHRSLTVHGLQSTDEPSNAASHE